MSAPAAAFAQAPDAALTVPPPGDAGAPSDAAAALGPDAAPLGAEPLSDAGPASTDALTSDAEAPVVTTATPAPEAPRELGAVVVTALRREQKLQDVPIAITALKGETVVRSEAVKTANDIVQFIPNASASATDGRTRPRWFLRGIGTNETAASTVSPIGIYFDDVYLNNVYIQGFPLFDLDRIEVLRGPQGTLWGKNTTGGAIHYVSRKPTFDLGGYGRASLGSFYEQSYQGAIGGPVIGEVLAARVSFFSERRRGWVYNQATDRKDGALVDNAVRAQLLFSPGFDFEALLTAKLRHLQGDKSPSFYVTDPTQPLRNPLYRGPLEGRDAIAQAGRAEELLDADGTSLRLTWGRGGYDVTSISAFDRGRRVLFTPSPIAVEITRARAYSFSRQVTQELRLTSPATDRVSWIVGGYFFYEELKADAVNRRDRVPGASGMNDSPMSASPFGWDQTAFEQKTTSFAPFGSFTVRLLEALSLSGGLRFSAEKKSYDLSYVSSAMGAAYNNNVSEWWRRESVTALNDPILSSDSHTWRELTYDATVQYKATKNINAYVRYAHGFRAGGYVVSPANTYTRLDPETLDATEVGLKTQWLKGRLTFNTALFNYDYKDIIVGVLLPVPGTTMTQQVQENAASGYSRGAEFELAFYPNERLRLLGSVGLLSTEYEDYSSSASGQTIEASGNRFTRSPKLSATLDVEYRLALPDFAEIGVGTDWSYRTKQYFNAVNQSNPTLEQTAYVLGNARLFYRAAKGRFELSAYVRNLTDEVYSALATGPANGMTRQVYGLPRAFGSSLTVKF